MPLCSSSTTNRSIHKAQSALTRRHLHFPGRASRLFLSALASTVGQCRIPGFAAFAPFKTEVIILCCFKPPDLNRGQLQQSKKARHRGDSLRALSSCCCIIRHTPTYIHIYIYIYIYIHRCTAPTACDLIYINNSSLEHKAPNPYCLFLLCFNFCQHWISQDIPSFLKKHCC
jgi:hypothetical protein